MKLCKKIVFIISTMVILGGCGEDETFKTEESIKTAPNYSSINIKSKISDNKIDVYWDFNNNVKSYLLEFGSKENGFNEKITLKSDVTNYKITNLEYNQVYIFKLTALFTDVDKKESKVIQVKIASKDDLSQVDNGPQF